jgi:DNA replication protein DnaC
VHYNVPEEHPYFGKIFVCECRQDQAEAEQVAYLRRLGGLESLADRRLETFNPDGVGLTRAQQENLSRVYEAVIAYAAAPKGWLVISGGHGCGKTHLAAAIANAQIDAGNKVIFATVPDLLDHLRAAFHPDATEEYDARFEEVRSAPLLILDDLGMESPTPWATEKLYQILNHRYNARLPTVITTNHHLSDLETRLRSRLTDPDLCQTLAITASDYRRGGIVRNYNELSDLGWYSKMTFRSFSVRANELTKEQTDNLRKAVTLASEYSHAPQGWLLLMGPYGCGKTHLAAAIANAYAAEGAATLFVTVPDLLDHLRAAFAPGSTVSYDRRFAEIKTVPLLILDDLGTESATPWAREKLYQLFNYRYIAKLPTVITTSHELETLDARLVTRLRDQEFCKRVAILAPTYIRQTKDRGT